MDPSSTVGTRSTGASRRSRPLWVSRRGWWAATAPRRTTPPRPVPPVCRVRDVAETDLSLGNPEETEGSVGPKAPKVPHPLRSWWALSPGCEGFERRGPHPRPGGRNPGTGLGLDPGTPGDTPEIYPELTGGRGGLRGWVSSHQLSLAPHPDGPRRSVPVHAGPPSFDSRRLLRRRTDKIGWTVYLRDSTRS